MFNLFLILALVFTITAYDDSSGIGITASGTQTREGICACGPTYPFGTIFYVEGVGRFVCQDRGGLVTDDNIDIWLPSYQEAMEFGIRQAEVTAWIPIGVMTEKDKFSDFTHEADRLWTILTR